MEKRGDENALTSCVPRSFMKFRRSRGPNCEEASVRVTIVIEKTTPATVIVELAIARRCARHSRLQPRSRPCCAPTLGDDAVDVKRERGEADRGDGEEAGKKPVTTAEFLEPVTEKRSHLTAGAAISREKRTDANRRLTNGHMHAGRTFFPDRARSNWRAECSRGSWCGQSSPALPCRGCRCLCGSVPSKECPRDCSGRRGRSIGVAAPLVVPWSIASSQRKVGIQEKPWTNHSPTGAGSDLEPGVIG